MLWGRAVKLWKPRATIWLSTAVLPIPVIGSRLRFCKDTLWYLSILDSYQETESGTAFYWLDACPENLRAVFKKNSVRRAYVFGSVFITVFNVGNVTGLYYLSC